jgi:hypothetical protein
MRTFKFWYLVSLSAATILTPLLVAAQQAPAKPDPAPPKLEKLEESEPPSIKVGKPEQKDKITETRGANGATEVKVHTDGSTYYVKPDQQVGDSLPGDAQSVHNHGAQWKVMEFDLGSKQKKAPVGIEPAPKDGSLTDEPKK